MKLAIFLTLLVVVAAQRHHGPWSSRLAETLNKWKNEYNKVFLDRRSISNPGQGFGNSFQDVHCHPLRIDQENFQIRAMGSQQGSRGGSRKLLLSINPAFETELDVTINGQKHQRVPVKISQQGYQQQEFQIECDVTIDQETQTIQEVHSVQMKSKPYTLDVDMECGSSNTLLKACEELKSVVKQNFTPQIPQKVTEVTARLIQKLANNKIRLGSSQFDSYPDMSGGY